jgi:hypothetical protein
MKIEYSYINTSISYHYTDLLLGWFSYSEVYHIPKVEFSYGKKLSSFVFIVADAILLT